MNGLPKKLVTEAWLIHFETTGKGWLRILSGSMAPLIQTGDQICIKKIDPSHILIGDIITFWKGDILVTHRIISKVRDEKGFCYVERGDRNSQYAVVNAHAVVGKVIRIKKGEQEIAIESVWWQLFNRLVGLAFLTTRNIRTAGKKIAFIPAPVKRFITKVFALGKILLDKLLFRITKVR